MNPHTSPRVPDFAAMRWRSPHRTPERLGPTARPPPALVPPYPPASWRPAGGTRASDGARGMPAAAPAAHGARRAGDGPLSRLAEAVARAGLLDSDALEQAAAACLEVLAEVVGARGQPELAARLVGAADTLRGPPAGVGAEGCSPPAPAVDRSGLAVATDGVAWHAGRGLAPQPVGADQPGPPSGYLPRADGAGAAPSRPSAADPLTPREREIASLLARGLSNKEIAQALVIAERTVKTHVTHILTKLDLVSRVQVGPWAAAHGLLPTESR